MFDSHETSAQQVERPIAKFRSDIRPFRFLGFPKWSLSLDSTSDGAASFLPPQLLKEEYNTLWLITI